MREFRTYGSVRGPLSNGRPYRVRLKDQFGPKTALVPSTTKFRSFGARARTGAMRKR